MPYKGQDTILGWAVVRANPWHLAGIFADASEAEVKASELVGDYAVRYGEGRPGSDDFISAA
jgi:hypothetical protein